MSVETYILIAIVIFGVVSIFTLLSISHSVASAANRMAHIGSDIKAIRETLDDYPGPKTSRGDLSESHLQDIKLNASLISDRASETALKTSFIYQSVDLVKDEISQFRNDLRHEFLRHRPPSNFDDHH